MRNDKVHRITASSGNSNYQPSFAKFGNVGWSPSKADLHPWLKIDLGDLYLICGFKVQGCRDGAVETYVRRYRVQVSPEDNFWDSWNYIKVINERARIWWVPCDVLSVRGNLNCINSNYVI